MRLQTRLTLATTGIVVLLGASIGITAMAVAEGASIAGIDRVLDRGIALIANEREDKMAAAMLEAQQVGDSFEVIYVDQEGSIIALSVANGLITELPPPSTLVKAASEAVTVTGIEIDDQRSVRHTAHTPYRLRAYATGEGDWYLMASSMDAVLSSRLAMIWLLTLTTGVAVFFAVIAVAIFTRRDLRKIARLTAEAERIAGGDLQGAIVREDGSSEVDRLTRALERMVSELRAAVTAASAASERMQRFLGDASHELRTPLTVIRGYLELLARGDRSGDVDPALRQRAIDRINSESARMERLISDLLMLAELTERGRASAEAADGGTLAAGEVIGAPTDLGELTAVAAQDLATLQPERPVIADIARPAFTRANGDQLRQLLANLISNVARHTALTDTVRISLQLRVADPVGGVNGSGEVSGLVLRVEDSGPGLPDEAYKRPMDAFERFDPSRSRERGGSGLGMSIIAAIVSANGGTLELSRSELGGLCTTVTLPG